MDAMTKNLNRGHTDKPPLARFQFPREVRLVDTDATGLMHFSAYVRMMEETEYAFLRSRGLSVVLQDEKGTIGFPRLRSEIQIYQPLTCGQQVQVVLELVDLDGKQVDYHFSVLDEENALAVEGWFRAACCRFPHDQLPYAILIPSQVSESLLTAPTIKQS